MVREFSISAGGQTVVGANTLIAVNTPLPSNFNIEFLRFWVGQSANATSAQQRIELATKSSAFPTLTSSTPISLKLADANASVITGATTGAVATCGINASTEGAGTQVVTWDDAFNVLNGWLHVPTPPETRIYPAGYGHSLELYFPVSPATLTNWAYGLVYREV